MTNRVGVRIRGRVRVRIRVRVRVSVFLRNHPLHFKEELPPSISSQSIHSGT